MDLELGDMVAIKLPGNPKNFHVGQLVELSDKDAASSSPSTGKRTKSFASPSASWISRRASALLPRLHRRREGWWNKETVEERDR